MRERAVRQDLPRRYYSQLPKLGTGEYAGYPRVYALARDLVAHTAGRFDMQAVVGYIDAYQRDLEVILATDCLAGYDEEHARISLRYMDGKIARAMSNSEIEAHLAGSD